MWKNLPLMLTSNLVKDLNKVLNREYIIEDINDDIVFEIELVKQIEVNIDYILALIAKKKKEGATNKEIVASKYSGIVPIGFAK